jgi:hypothetical protein
MLPPQKRPVPRFLLPVPETSSCAYLPDMSKMRKVKETKDNMTDLKIPSCELRTPNRVSPTSPCVILPSDFASLPVRCCESALVKPFTYNKLYFGQLAA